MAGQPAVKQLIGHLRSAKAWLETPAGRRLQRGLSILLSVAVLLFLAHAIGRLGWREVMAALPASPLFWIAFVGSYLLPPLGDWIIYRRWWPIRWRSIAIFLKMRVLNEALFAYSGHAYLMAWASKLFGQPFDPERPVKILGRGAGRGLDPSANPVAAIKDMAITSGLAGNLATLLLLLLALALGGGPIIGKVMDPRTVTILASAFFAMVVANLAIVVFRNRVMSIPARANLFAFLVHLMRVTMAHFLLVASWIVALPMIDFGTWFLLGALRMVIMRMPVPNKEILFAAIAVELAGEASLAVAALMAAQGAFHLVLHAIAWGTASALEASGPTGDGRRAPEASQG